MRPVHWLYVVSVVLFSSGIAFIIAGARAQHRGVAATAAPALSPVATTKQIMIGIVDPAATMVFNSVGTRVSRAGVEHHAPADAAAWEAVGSSAAALIESGNLLLMEPRVVDQGEWVAMARAMIDAGRQVLRATVEKNPDKVLETGGILYESCDNCHRRYRRTR